MMYVLQITGFRAILVDNKECIAPFLEEWAKTQTAIVDLYTLNVEWVNDTTAGIMATAKISEEDKKMWKTLGIDMENLKAPIGAIIGMVPMSTITEMKPNRIEPAVVDHEHDLGSMEVAGHG